MKVFGEAPFRNPAVLSRLGLVPEGDRLPSGLRADRWLRMMGELSGLSDEGLKAAVARVLGVVGMADRAHLTFARMSKGMRQRIRLAQALLHEPELLILDEPFNGLDPEARLTLMALLRDLAEKGTRILVSSHILGEIAQLTDRILLLFRGRLLAEGSVPEIRQLLDRHPVELRLTGEAQVLARWAVEQPELAALRMEDGAVVISVRSPQGHPAPPPEGRGRRGPADSRHGSPGPQPGRRLPVPDQGPCMMLSGGSTLRDSMYHNAARCSHAPQACGHGASPRAPAPGAGEAHSGLTSQPTRGNS